jgi:hypothetical protein
MGMSASFVFGPIKSCIAYSRPFSFLGGRLGLLSGDILPCGYLGGYLDGRGTQRDPDPPPWAPSSLFSQCPEMANPVPSTS